MFSSLLKDTALGVVRHLATGTGGWLIAHGIIQHSQLNGWIGSLCFLGGVAWSAWDKYHRTGNI